jgi:hypothetical protein
LQAWLVDAQVSYSSGDHARGRRSLASALRLGEREQLRLPFAMRRAWLRSCYGAIPDWPAPTGNCSGPGLTSPGSAPGSQATTAIQYGE